MGELAISLIFTEIHMSYAIRVQIRNVLCVHNSDTLCFPL